MFLLQIQEQEGESAQEIPRPEITGGKKLLLHDLMFQVTYESLFSFPTNRLLSFFCDLD